MHGGISVAFSCQAEHELMTSVAINFGDGDGRVSSMKAHQEFDMLKNRDD